MMLTTKHLRRQALAGSLFRPATLARAIQRLGFVQADPIRAPARAQDLILRHRVRGYQAGDLEAQYSELDIEEDFLYAYGFMPQSTWLLLHPRSNRNSAPWSDKSLKWYPAISRCTHVNWTRT